MPLLHAESVGREQIWGIWHLTEQEQDLAYLSFHSSPEEIVHPQKRLEWLGGRALIKALAEKCGIAYAGIDKDEFGKPFLKDHPHHISLSHSFPYVAGQVDGLQPVGIDLEQPKEKLKAIASRVFSPGEVADAGDDLTKLCIYWCAKEALYKLYGKRNLLFTDHLQIMPFKLSGAGIITGKIVFLNQETIVQLQYKVQPEYVLVFTGQNA